MTTPAFAPIEIAGHAPALENCFLFDETEDSYAISGIKGRIPEWLLGSWYVIGPAKFERSNLRYKHWLDGDGIAGAVRFTSEGCYFTNRYIHTRKWNEEEKAGRFIYRAFGTSFPGDRLRRNVMLEPPVNVNICPFAGRLLAFGEQSLPYELDPVTLETRGEFDFDGALNEVSPFAAHAAIDRGLLNFGVSFAAAKPALNVYEFNVAGKLERRRRYPLEHPYSMHDFGFTESRLVFFLSPLLLDYQRFSHDGASILESLTWRPDLGSSIFIAPRAGQPAPAFSVPAGPGYCLHMINCFELNGWLTVDVLLFDSPVYPEYQTIPDLFSSVSPCCPARFVIDLERRKLISRTELGYCASPDFPSVEPSKTGKPYHDFWMLGISASGHPGRKFFDQLVHGSWREGGASDIFHSPPGEYLGAEPCVVSHPTDPEQAVVILERIKASASRSELLIFDAFAVRRGPVAVLPLRHHIHPGFHTSFARLARP